MLLKDKRFIPETYQGVDLRKTTGFIYVVQMSGYDIFKIGRTQDVPTRMSQFGIQLPFPHVLRFAVRTDRYVTWEDHLHGIFESNRMNGEWFRLTDQDVTYIRNLLLHQQAWELYEQVKTSLDWTKHIDEAERIVKVLMLVVHRIQRRERALYSDDEQPAPEPLTNSIN